MLERWRKIAVQARPRAGLSWALGLALVAGACLPTPPTTGPEQAEPGAAAEPGGPSLWSAKTPGQVYARGEVRAFAYVQAGQLIGRSYGRYEGPVVVDGQTLHRFSSKLERVADPQAAGGLDPESLRGQGELWLDEQGRMVRAWERSEAAELRLTLDADTLQAEAVTGVPRDETWSHPVDEGAAAMGYMSAFYEELMFATRDLPAGNSSWPLISLSTGSVDRWEGRVQLGQSGLEVRTSLGERVHFVDGRIRSIEVADIQLVVEAIDEPTWPRWEIDAPVKLSYAPAPDAKFERRAVELAGKAGEPTLKGEVLVPRESTGQPRPAVVMLSGSSATDRHGFAGPPAVDLGYHAWGDALANAGFVVLRFDDRGVGESAFAPNSWLGDLEDARRALRTLLVQPEVDPDRVLVVGHGEGGWRALALSAEYPKSVVGVALVGTPGRSYRRIIGASQPEVLKALEAGASLPSLLEANRDWFAEILRFDLEGVLRKGKAPLWIVFGEADFEFDPDTELHAWGELSRETGRRSSVTRYEGLDHLLKPAVAVGEGPVASAAAYKKTRAVDPGFLAALVAWANERAASK